RTRGEGAGGQLRLATATAKTTRRSRPRPLERRIRANLADGPKTREGSFFGMRKMANDHMSRGSGCAKRTPTTAAAATRSTRIRRDFSRSWPYRPPRCGDRIEEERTRWGVISREGTTGMRENPR
ncbi:hypothetical protein ACHAWF_013961, partial [Thalassiosira exigua]